MIDDPEWTTAQAEESAWKLLQTLYASEPPDLPKPAMWWSPTETEYPGPGPVLPQPAPPGVDIAYVHKLFASVSADWARRFAEIRWLPTVLSDALSNHPHWRARAPIAAWTPDEAALRRLSRDREPLVRAHATWNAQLKPDDLYVYATDKRAEVRAYIAEQRRTPQPLLEDLTRDKARVVRWHLLWAHGSNDRLAYLLKDDTDPNIRSHANSILTAPTRHHLPH